MAARRHAGDRGHQWPFNERLLNGGKPDFEWDYRGELEFVDRDIVGYDVEATDGRIGKIDESSHDASQAYLVVDTGFWIFGKKRLIPAGVVQQIDDEAAKVFVTLSKDEIKQAPDFDERHRDVRDEYEVYYGRHGP